MIINLIETDPSDASAPAAIKTAWQQAATMLGALFTDNITVNINVTYGVANGTSAGASAGPNNGLYESYTSVYNYLTQQASPGDSSFALLPAPPSLQADQMIAVWPAQLKLMGLSPPAADNGVDGSADFGTGVQASLMVGVALHEFTHALGRVPYGLNPDILETDRFTSDENRLFDGGVPATSVSYFSLNGGLTKWADYGVSSDPSDFLNTYAFGGDPSSPLSPEDAFNQFYDNHTLQYLTPLDLEQMDVLGFHLKYDAPATDNADFLGDNTGDVLVQNGSGQIVYDQMAAGVFQTAVTVTSLPGWTVVGQGKISGGASSDIVVENASDQIAYLNMVHGGFVGMVSVATVPGFKVVGVGDVNDDHYQDIVIQNRTTDEIGYANMHNGTLTNWYSVGEPVGWNAVAVGDLNYDGFADIVIQNRTTDEVGYANMSNGVFNNWTSVADPVGWNVVGAGDITNLGDADLVFQNRSSGQIIYGKMNNGALSNFVNVGTMPGWNVIGVEDVIGNGYDDIVVENPLTGQIQYADMTGGTFQGWVNVNTAAGFNGLTVPAVAANNSALANSNIAAAPNAPVELLYTGSSVPTPPPSMLGGEPIVGSVAVAPPDNTALAVPRSTGNA